MLTLINALFCHAKVGVGDMDYYGIKNSEQLEIQPWSIKPQENLNYLRLLESGTPEARRSGTSRHIQQVYTSYIQ